MPARGRCVTAIATLVAAGLLPPSAPHAEPPDGRWDRALQERGLSSERVPDPFVITPEMREAAREVAGELPPRERLERLQQFLFDGISFDYEAEETVPAAAAWEQRRGNCVAFTTMFIALARSLGIAIQPALIYTHDREEIEGDLVISRNHVVAMYVDGPRIVIYDFNLRRRGTPVSVQPIDDLWMGAIHLSNRAVVALRSSGLESAHAELEGALRLAPGYSALWGNLGVVRRRLGDIEGALDAYAIALRLDPSNASARRNLVTLLEHRSPDGHGRAGHRGGADDTMERGDSALRDGELRRAFRLYRRAHRRAPRDPAPLIAMARARLVAGETAAAIEWLDRALVVSPEHEHARRLREGLLRIRSGVAAPATRIPVPRDLGVTADGPPGP